MKSLVARLSSLGIRAEALATTSAELPLGLLELPVAAAAAEQGKRRPVRGARS